eukprot:TRINITY_DN66585_c0_g1_i1.p1 TRINITY_DN66585_c0_g1~~TRINITY_DN66585_c0_g1_i1.p1  ORF type:complete len:208 (+),score=57.07 TRINITY_DN66585_c0_g1_i1:26-625(+)
MAAPRPGTPAAVNGVKTQLAGFPAPPPQWQLFQPGCEVLVAAPRPPSATASAHAFGEPLTLEPPPLPLDADEWLCNPEAPNLGKELLGLYDQLQDSGKELLECLQHKPAEHAGHLRRLGDLAQSMRGLLHIMRAREASALVLQQLQDQVARKRRYAEDAKAALPGLADRLAGLAASPEAGSEIDSDGAPPAKQPRSEAS